MLSHGYYDAYYLQAQKIRRMIADDFQNAFKECDIIAGPVAPPWPGSWVTTATTRWPTTWPTSSPARLCWLVCRHERARGFGGAACRAQEGVGNPLPVGLQLIGNYFQEARLTERCAPPAANHRLPPPPSGGGRHDRQLIHGYEVVIGF